MKEPTPELIAEINALQSMCTEEIRKRYAALLGVDLERSMNCNELRAGIAYKLQELFYGMSIPADVVKAIESAGEPASGTGRLLAGTKIVRRWKGEDHEIEMRADGLVEYRRSTGLCPPWRAGSPALTGTEKSSLGLRDDTRNGNWPCADGKAVRRLHEEEQRGRP